MRDYMMALHQRFCKEPECREVLDRRGQEQLLKLAGAAAEAGGSGKRAAG